MTKVLVLGGGLGGLISATSLAEVGFDVTLVEASDRYGGKAGSYFINGRWWDHGWHGFPAFYFNLRGWLQKLGITLVDFDASVFVDKLPAGGMANAKKLFLPKNPFNPLEDLKMIFSGVLPPAQMLLYLRFLTWAMGQVLKKNAELDRIGRTALMRGQWYITQEILDLDTDSMLKGTAVASSDMSAMTWQNVMRNWGRTPSPFMSVLPGPMQTTFIDPLVAYAQQKGVKMSLNERATAIRVSGNRISSVDTVDANQVTHTYTPDALVSAIPPEHLRPMASWDLMQADTITSTLWQLRTVPMGSVHLALKTKRTDIPKDPVFLKGGKWGLSFVDMSQLVPNPPPTTELSVVVALSANLQSLSEADQFTAIMDELAQFTGITASDVQEYHVIPNVVAPLTINDIASWQYRPKPRSKTVGNLFFACDWAKSPYDLMGMESATYAAMMAAQALAADHGKTLPTPVKAPQYPRWLMSLVATLMWPVLPPAYLWARIVEGAHPPK
ncbi:MAG: FAD-dependent oxidoreductase [Myxococcota bacterium]